MEVEQKPKWYTRKKVWAGILAAGAAIAGIFGYGVSPDLVAELAGILAAIGALL